jgi:N-dimethylarginine dimethylaminohydrolase
VFDEGEVINTSECIFIMDGVNENCHLENITPAVSPFLYYHLNTFVNRVDQDQDLLYQDLLCVYMKIS